MKPWGADNTHRAAPLSPEISGGLMTASSCECGKAVYTSRAAAGRALIGAKIAHDLHGKRNRREGRAYRCPGNRDLWHLTSQAARPSPLPTYPDTDDDAARTFIIRAIDKPRDDVWQALLADDRLRQTVRVLGVLQQEAITVRQAPGFRDSDGKARALEWEAAIRARIHAARVAEKALNIREAQIKTGEENRRNHQALRQLTIAVARHRADTVNATAADRELWDWLDALVVPDSGGEAPLSDLVERWLIGATP